MKEQIRITVISLLWWTALLGIVYPLFIFGVGQIFFPHFSNGSILKDASGRPVGAYNIGQNFSSPRYFHPRPSNAGADGYDATSSGASNLGPTSEKLINLLHERIENYRAENRLSPTEPIPADAVMSSGSGLDPHISVQNAYLQMPRVAAARNIPESELRELIRKETSQRWLGVFGEKRVNVLVLNIKLDKKY
jgi:K+-transporting ATPase ATPase C chain